MEHLTPDWPRDRLAPWEHLLYVTGLQDYVQAARTDPDGRAALDALHAQSAARLDDLTRTLGGRTLTPRTAWRWERRFMESGREEMDALTARYPNAATALNLIKQGEQHRRQRLIAAARDHLST